MLNHTMLIGRFVTIENDKNKNAIVTIAITRRFKNANGIYETDFIKCKAFSYVAKKINEYCFDDEEIKEKLSEISAMSLIKLVLTGEYEIDLEKNTDYLYSELKDGFFFVKIKDDSRLKIDYSSYAFDRSLKGEFVRNVLDDISLSEQEKNDIIMCGIKAFGGDKSL